ncbi:GNAT family N-acetyltransferase [Paenibacillus sp. OAS669]|uniref:GNAT family N-acetyltransferase n=1 Tax=Paenibacillus sp. OAS669 TaxID=2663821 RepID=UPI0017892D5A|nr:GNAT family N-acetyltransferase [Paenibacillus sp. OAS669]MBE1442065.1 GNAT superfamily N-acetyltransferase [Paenibacillus sp. OAS669]
MNQAFTIHDHLISENSIMVQAQPQDTEAIMALLIEIAEWLRSKGSSQWRGLLEGHDSHNTVEAVRRGDVFVCKKEGSIAGVVMLLQKPSEWDYKLWGAEAHPEDRAVYIHRLAVKREFANSGLGQAILQWCDSGIHFDGKTIVRLDCIASSPQLNQFYSRNGYTYKGEQDGFSKYEKSVTFKK